MKFLILFALVAAALGEPEADPATVYTNGVFHTNVENLHKGIHTQHAAGYGSLYNTVPYVKPVVYTKPYVTTTYAKPVVHSTYVNPYVYGSPFVQKLFKREAESEPEADPLKIYHNVGYTGYQVPYTTAYSHAVPSYYNAPLAYTTGYTGYTGYNMPYMGYSRLFKREAESEADPLTVYSTGYQYPLSTYSHIPKVYNAPYTTYAAGYPTYTTGYTGYHMPYMGYSRLFKREAESEPEADPWTVYRTQFPYTTYAGAGVLPTYYNKPLTYTTPLAYNYRAYTPYQYYY